MEDYVRHESITGSTQKRRLLSTGGRGERAGGGPARAGSRHQLQRHRLQSHRLQRHQRPGGWLHNSVNLLKSIELYAYNRDFMVYKLYVNETLEKKRKARASEPECCPEPPGVQPRALGACVVSQSPLGQEPQLGGSPRGTF